MVSKPQWVDANVNNFLPIKARKLKFCVCYLRGKSAPLTNFQPCWTTRSKLSYLQPVLAHSAPPLPNMDNFEVTLAHNVFGRPI